MIAVPPLPVIVLVAGAIDGVPRTTVKVAVSVVIVLYIATAPVQVIGKEAG